MAKAQSVNDAVEIDFKGVWYPGKVLKVEGEMYFVSYDEWDAVWNEWVGAERLRAITPLRLRSLLLLLSANTKWGSR